MLSTPYTPPSLTNNIWKQAYDTLLKFVYAYDRRIWAETTLKRMHDQTLLPIKELGMSKVMN